MKYAMRSTLASLWRDKWLNLLCTTTIAIGLFLIAMASVLVHNINLATSRIPDNFAITAFLKQGVPDNEGRDVAQRVEAISGVTSARFISREEALSDLERALDDPDFILGGLKGTDNPLPSAIEIRLARKSVTDEGVKAVTDELRSMTEVDDVIYASELLGLIQSLKHFSDRAGIGFIAIVACSSLFVSYSTVKILLYRKTVEIDIMKLLGATKWFIRWPFLLEGSLIGAISGLIALAGSVAVYITIHFKLAASIPIAGTIETPMIILAAIPLAGIAVGMIGSMLAVGRIRF